MRTQPSDSLAMWPEDVTAPNGVLVLSGYGLSVRVWRGRLRLADGIGPRRREVVLHRAMGRLKRLVVLGHTGTVSLEAIRWLADVGAGFLQIDADGRVLAAFGALGSDRAGLRRAQARALDTPVGTDLARRLIGEKISAQAETLARIRGADVTDLTLTTLRDALTRLHVAATRDDVRFAESLAAAAYWSAIAPVGPRFARRDADLVPDHWRVLGSRGSALTGSPRSATNPVNAILNYLYAILEGEATIAARVVGLDPGLGVLHADLNNRDSLSADLMEPVRPVVDRYVFDLLSRRSFASEDFFETRQGVCRVTLRLAQELAGTAPDWGRAVGRVAEDVARRLAADADVGATPTPLSGRNRAAGRPGVTARAPRVTEPRTLGQACTWCGRPVEGSRKTCSEPCRAEIVAADRPAFIAAGVDALAQLRASGWTAVLSDEGRRNIGASAANGVRAARAWQREHAWPKDLGAFARDIWPRLEGLSARDLARATGLSVGYCARIKKGEAVPHPMWWEAFQDAADDAVGGPVQGQ